ncbi:MAG: glycosyltransferase family 2 protein [Adlercreutzia equolifaciens]
MKTITFAVPCYNSAAYMDHCVETLLACGEDIEILLVDDGSTKDDTAAICDRWQNEHPDIVRAIHQPNKGHGGAVNTGLAHATGFYFKVVDSDDWLDPAAMFPLMVYLRSQLDAPVPCDMVVANYVYDKVDEGEQKVMGYGNVLPEGYEFGWDEVGTFLPSQYLLMHSVYYRTEMLRKMHLTLPEHTFYVDNIFVYEPLVYVRTMRYFNVDAYHYFIGREDQSVNEKVMMGRMDQQLRVTRQMIDNVDPQAVRNRHLRHYLRNYLSMMMFRSVLAHARGRLTSRIQDIWAYLKEQNPSLPPPARTRANLATNLLDRGRREDRTQGYQIAQKIFKIQLTSRIGRVKSRRPRRARVWSTVTAWVMRAAMASACWPTRTTGVV